MKRQYPYYPVLIALFPLLALYTANVGKMSFTEIGFPWGVILCLMLVAALVFRLFCRGWQHVALLVSFLFVYLFSYRWLISEIRHNHWRLFGFVKFDLYLLGWAALALILLFVLRFVNQLGGLTKFLNFSCTILVFLELIRAGQGYLNYRKMVNDIFSKSNNSQLSQQVNVPSLPDIYYVILDAYGRSDILRSIYGYDNSPILQSLRDMGFYVADEAHSNYCQTFLSLGSSLNLTHLPQLDLGRRVTGRKQTRAEIRELVTENKLVRDLRAIGYKLVSFSSGYSGTDLPSADFAPRSRFSLSEYQNVVLGLTPIPDFLRLYIKSSLRNWQFVAHRQRIKFIFKELPKISEMEGPKFVLAHVMAPHPPFVFSADGASVQPEGGFTFRDGSHLIGRQDPNIYVRGYAAQVEFISRELQSMLKELVTRAPRAIIIVQGDHGPGSQLNWKDANRSNMAERFGILNAYYVPDEIKEKLYPSISPVNSFRLVMNYLTKTEYEILPDRSYFSTWGQPYNFSEVSFGAHPKNSLVAN